MGGIIQPDPTVDALATKGGRTINMPFWKDLTGDDEVLSDTAGLTPAKLSAGQDVATLLMRGKSWSVNDLAKSVAGSDPMQAVATMVADFWARKYQSVLIASLDGVISSNVANDASDMTKNLAGATNADVTQDTMFSADAFIDGQSTFGDAFDGITGIAMHPSVYFNMMKLDPTSFEKQSEGDLSITTYRGLRVIVNRNLPFTPAVGTAPTDAAPLYTSYLFGSGAFALGHGAAPVPTETSRNSSRGDDELYTRNHFILHPRGIKFNDASVAGSSPSNAELKLPANWTRVYERENVRIAAVITNG